MRLKLPDSLRRNLADLSALFVLPLVSALLPWRLAFAILKRMARWSWLCRASVEPAWLAARPHLQTSGDTPVDELEWKARFRLLRLVDQVDTWLTLLRSRRWWSRHIDTEGVWPSDAAPCVLLTCHWGAGGCVWKLLRAHGIHAWFLARRPQVGDLGSGRISAWYGRLRGWALGRIGSLGPLFTGGSSARVLQALALGQGVVGMLDLPARSAQAGTTLPLLDGTVHFPDGLARLAESAGVGVVLFTCGLNPQNGRRNLRVETLAAGTAADEIMRRYAAHLDRRLREESAHWQIWREADGLFVEGSVVRTIPTQTLPLKGRA